MAQNKLEQYSNQRYAIDNPTLDFFGGNTANLQAINPAYFKYLSDPTSFDYSTAPTGKQFVGQIGNGSNNDFVVDWDKITGTYNDKQAADKAATDAAAQVAADKLATDNATAATTAKRTSDISSARDIAARRAGDEFTASGVNGANYQSQLDQYLNDLVTGLGSDADPYASLNGKDAADSILNTALGSARSNYSNDVSQKIGTNYGDKLISSNLLDNTITDILNEQKTGAADYLERGAKRGIYNEAGLAAGQKELANDESAGRSQLTSLAGGVLDKYRTEANTVRDNAYGAASGYTLGGKFNIDDYLGQGNDILSRATTLGGGDLRGALGGQNFFDFGDLNNKVGLGQGAINSADTDVLTALSNRKKVNGLSRGLGSEGAF